MKKATKLENFFPAIILLFLCFVLLSISMTVPMGNDEGMWSYMGRIWIENNMPPYVYSVENKTPGIFILHAVSYKFFGIGYMPVRVLGVLSILISSYLLYWIATQLYNRFAGLLSMLIFGLTMGWAAMNGSYTGQTETFMVLFTIAGIYFLLENLNKKNTKNHLFFSGVFFGLAIAFKQVAVVTCVPIFFFLLFSEKWKNLKFSSFQPVILFSSGVLSSTIISIVPLFLDGVEIKDYIEGAWLILLQKSSTVPMRQHIANFQMVWINNKIISFYPFFLLIVYLLIRKKNQIYNLLGLILLFDFFAVNLSGNYYGHQFKQLLPGLSLLTALSISHLVNNFKHKKRETILKPCILLLTGFYFFPFGQSLHTEKKDPAKAIGEWIKNHTDPNAYIYTPNYHYNSILSYSERLSSSNYFNFIFVDDRKEMNEVLKDLKEKPPSLIIGKMPADNTYEPCLPAGRSMGDYMRKNYKKIKTMHGIDIFGRK